MKHYYIVAYKRKVNDRILRRIVNMSRRDLIRWFDMEPDKLITFVKISKKEAKYMGYKFD